MCANQKPPLMTNNYREVVLITLPFLFFFFSVKITKSSEYFPFHFPRTTLPLPRVWSMKTTVTVWRLAHVLLPVDDNALRATYCIDACRETCSTSANRWRKITPKWPSGRERDFSTKNGKSVFSIRPQGSSA